AWRCGGSGTDFHADQRALDPFGSHRGKIVPSARPTPWPATVREPERLNPFGRFVRQQPLIQDFDLSGLALVGFLPNIDHPRVGPEMIEADLLRKNLSSRSYS